MTRVRLVQFALLWLTVSALVCLTTVWRWQGQGADVGAGDILLQLLLLPLALAAVLATAIWLVGRTRREAARPVVASGLPVPPVLWPMPWPQHGRRLGV